MTEEDYILLVYKNLKEEISADEFDLLNITTASNPMLAKTRVDIENAWDISGQEKNIVSVTETNDLFNRLIENETPSKASDSKTENLQIETDKTGKIFSLNRIISSIAAVLVLALGAVFLFQSDTITYDKAGVYTLADNSIVTLREGSVLKVNKFNKSVRSVEIVGEAYFEIEKDTARPFTVSGKHIKIRVLGTSFLVKEYGEETFIDLTEGKISTLDSRTNNTEILTTGMKAHHKSNGQIDIINGYNNLASWREGFFEYRDTNLGSVVDELSIIFDTKVVLINKDLLQCSFSGNIVGNSIDEVLKPISEKYNIDILQQKSQWILSNGTCD